MLVALRWDDIFSRDDLQAKFIFKFSICEVFRRCSWFEDRFMSFCWLLEVVQLKIQGDYMFAAAGAAPMWVLWLWAWRVIMFLCICFLFDLLWSKAQIFQFSIYWDEQMLLLNIWIGWKIFCLDHYVTYSRKIVNVWTLVGVFEIPSEYVRSIRVAQAEGGSSAQSLRPAPC